MLCVCDGTSDIRGQAIRLLDVAACSNRSNSRLERREGLECNSSAWRGKQLC